MHNFAFRVLWLALLAGGAGWFVYRVQLMNPPVSAQTTIQLQPLVSGLSRPLFITSARDGSSRLFVLERAGLIRLLTPGASEPSPAPFLDLTAKVMTSTTQGDERGLLGLAFHPQFKSNRRFYVNYTRRPDGATVISEFRLSLGNANIADVDEKVLLTFPQPFSNHNGGMMDFGKDGFLYIGTGDGGSANDPGNRAQNIEELLGKFLRIDVDTPNGAVPYSSPPSNPFFGATPGRDEIYAFGLRNPWRWSFDRETGQLYAGDVGQGVVEEIDLIEPGKNYGWRVLEGTRCTNLGPASCAQQSFTPPIHEYQHSGGRCSVTGGYVYRGKRQTLPAGAYVFGDYCTGEIFLLENGPARLLLDTPYNIASFGEDELGELYLVDLSGTIYRLANPNAPANALANVSAATFRSGVPLAAESINAAFGAELAVLTLVNALTPLPTKLAGTQVSVRDSAGTERPAPLFFVSPTQVNYLVPSGTVTGNATVTIISWNGAVSRGTVQINPVAPGVFTANASGSGVAAAVVERLRANGTRSTEAVAQFDSAQNRFVPLPIDLGPEGDQVFLVLFGSGFRFRSGLSAVTVTIGGTPAEVTFAGAQGSFVGLDQVNVRLPRNLMGRGEMDVTLTVDGQTANTVSVSIK